MRPIEFRAWNERIKEIEEVHQLEWLYNEKTEFRDILDVVTPKAQLRDQPILMQFTGLLDKNGKKIFEGDIVKWLSFRLPITVDDFHGYTFMYGKDRFFRAVAEDGEVIGNIYENPELLG